MSIGDLTDDAPNAPRRRDAAGTRELLLSAARRRFAKQGYAATTVREIADDAGVNAALISRYFDSKEGLFEKCLVGVSAELGGSIAPGAALHEVARAIAEQIAGPLGAGDPNRLALLLRTSGDERAEKIRLETLQTYAKNLVQVTGGQSHGPGGAQSVLRAQLVLSAALGIAVLRSWTPLEPLASVDPSQLVEPIQALIYSLLAPNPAIGQ